MAAKNTEPTMLDWSTLEPKIKQFIPIGSSSKSKGFIRLMLATILALDEDEIDDSITDGGDDRGVDAIYVDERDNARNIHIFQFKHVTTFERAKNNFPSREIDKILSLITDILLKAGGLKDTANPLLFNKIQEIWGALESSDGPYSFTIHFCGNQQHLSPKQRARIDEALRPYQRFSVNEYSLQDIVGLFVEAREPRLDRKLRLVDMNYFERSDGNIRGLIGTSEAREIVRLISEEDGTVNPEIFNDNLRVYLKRRNKVNRKIYETALSDRNTEFWYRNNGITITCSHFTYQPNSRSPIVSLNDVQIVNGGQTSHALFEADRESPEALEPVLVLVRIYETQDLEISQRIAESTNSQTAVNSRDLKANDDIQKKLEEAFLGVGYYYERKLNQHADKPKSKRIDAFSAAQSYLAYHMCNPITAKKDRAKVYGNLYDDIFNDSITHEDLLASFLVFRVIEKRKRELKGKLRRKQRVTRADLNLLEGAHHILYCVGQMTRRMDRDLNDYDSVIQLIPRAIKLLNQTVQTEQKELEKADSVLNLPKFLKDRRSQTLIDVEIEKWHEKALSN